MTSITKPPVRHPSLPKNALGFTRRDYEGAMSTLCAGCGHDSVTAALIQAVWELDLQPHRVAKMSGIGCSSKTTAYFLKQSHGFNGVHGRMPAMATAGEYERTADAEGFELVRFQDRTREVAPTWPRIAWTFFVTLLRKPKYLRVLLHARNWAFAVAAIRLTVAYRVGAMRYGIFTFRVR